MNLCNLTKNEIKKLIFVLEMANETMDFHGDDIEYGDFVVNMILLLEKEIEQNNG